MSVILRNCSVNEFDNRTKGKRIFCFAAGKLPQRIFGMYRELEIEKRIVYYVDNNPEKAHKYGKLNDREIEIITPSEMVQAIRKDDIILIGTFRFKEVLEQLDAIVELNGMECYALKLFMEDLVNEPVTENIPYAENPRIPKKLHYCWFGKGEMGELEKRCIESWRRMCPDYEIICWNESNYDYTKSRYAREAYEMGKYAFVTDYARLDIVHKEGGIYFDTDVEIIKPIDELLYQDGFMGFDTNSLVNTGVGMGGIPGLELFATLRDAYDRYIFKTPDGYFNDLPNSYIQAEDLKPFGLQFNNRLQQIKGITFYPAEFFSPISYLTGERYITKNTYSIHWFSGTWQTSKSTDYRMEQQRVIREIVERIQE